MIVFDPRALVAPIAEITSAAVADSGSPAALTEVRAGALSVRLAEGVSNLETGVPADPGQTFENGSQTKMFTAVAVLQLVEEGLVGLDDRIADYLPDLTEGLPNGDAATIRQLLNMTSGIPNFTDAVDANGIPLFVTALQSNPDTVFGPADSLAIARGMEATGAPGEGYAYSNTNFELLGQLIERVTGQGYHEAVQERVLAPAGMTNTVPLLSDDPLRLSSYLIDPETNEPLDVSGALWDLRGEAGFASTTSDMIAFIEALLVDRVLLSPDMLAEMTDFFVTEEQPGYQAKFGLGLAAFTLNGTDTYVGFTGGSLGTASSTYINLETGAIIADAGTIDAFDSLGAGLAVLEALAGNAAWGPITDDGGPVSVASGAAAEMTLAQDEAGLHYTLGDATLTLDRDLSGVTTGNLGFADGSVLVVGDNRAGGMSGDNRGNRIDIARQFADAVDKDNAIYGLGGSDRLSGGNGADAIYGGTGRDKMYGGHGGDRLFGGADSDKIYGGSGDDRLSGGTGADKMYGGLGDDWLEGGAGSDILFGGAGADRFVFDLLEAAPGRDRIGDFQSGTDRIVLHVGGGESGLDWIADAAFSGTAGELRYSEGRRGITVQADLDGDGSADLSIDLRGVHDISVTDFVF